MQGFLGFERRGKKCHGAISETPGTPSPLSRRPHRHEWAGL